jgi:undecaprenyl-diphosphatase
MVFVSLFAGLIARYGVKSIIVFFYERPRPYINLPLAHKLIDVNPVENFQSFPSGHAIFLFALSAVIYGFNKKLGIFFLACSAIIALSRVFVGVHWPSDILGGAILGIGFGIAVNWLYIKYIK